MGQDPSSLLAGWRAAAGGSFQCGQRSSSEKRPAPGDFSVVELLPDVRSLNSQQFPQDGSGGGGQQRDPTRPAPSENWLDSPGRALEALVSPAAGL